MKKIVFAALVATVFATPAFAQTTDSTTVSGSITLACTIDSPTGITLDLDGVVQSVSNVITQCNGPDGYSILASSDNAGKLKHATAASNYAYTVGFPNSKTGVPLTATAAVLSALTGVDQKTNALKVTIGALTGSKFAGVYSDTIRFSIVSN